MKEEIQRRIGENLYQVKGHEIYKVASDFERLYLNERKVEEFEDQEEAKAAIVVPESF